MFEGRVGLMVGGGNSIVLILKQFSSKSRILCISQRDWLFAKLSTQRTVTIYKRQLRFYKTLKFTQLLFCIAGLKSFDFV